tara:strand:- start:19265 stop:19795 length:531 start_codon:yes stop_codon:yes gene_type:complete
MNKIEEQRKFVLGEVEIDLDPEKLRFSEQTISKYYQDEGGYYDYYSAQLAYAEFLLAKRELEYDVVFNEKFAANKEMGGSDKYVEAKTKADDEVVEAKNVVIIAKYKKSLLQQHIRAWDRNHDNALNLGHMLRKEMEKLGLELKGNRVSYAEEQQFNMSGPQELDIEELKKEIENG